MNQQQSPLSKEQAQSAATKLRKKTGPTPKYGPDQAKRMVSMRLSPSALGCIKHAAENIFYDSQADVVERITRLLPADRLEEVYKIADQLKVDPTDLVGEALSLYKEKYLAATTAIGI